MIILKTIVIVAGVLFIGIILAFLFMTAICVLAGEDDDMMTNEYYNADDDPYHGDIWS